MDVISLDDFGSSRNIFWLDKDKDNIKIKVQQRIRKARVKGENVPEWAILIYKYIDNSIKRLETNCEYEFRIVWYKKHLGPFLEPTKEWCENSGVTLIELKEWIEELDSIE